MHRAGLMCTGKRQTHIRSAPSPRTAVTGINPYNGFKNSVGSIELLQILRERAKKTEKCSCIDGHLIYYVLIGFTQLNEK